MTASEKIERLREAMTVYVSPAKFDELVAIVRADERERVERRIADALMTAERGDALVDVARCANSAEMELAARINGEDF